MDITGLLVGFVAGACGSLVLWLTIGRALMLKYAGKSVVNALRNPDEDTLEALDCVLDRVLVWSANPKVDSGKKDEDDRPILISPGEYLASGIARFVQKRAASVMGVDAHQRKALADRMQADILNNPELAPLLNNFLPDTMKYLARDSPLTAAFLQMGGMDIIKAFLSKKADTSSGGSSGGW